MNTLFLINPNAAGGRAPDIWARMEREAVTAFDGAQVETTRSMQAIPDVLEHAAQKGITQVIGVGGDGTNFSILNALVKRADQGRSFTYGLLPVGSGRDFARTLRIPFDPVQAITWLRSAQPRPIAIGEAIIDGSREVFLNVGGIGIDGDIAMRINRSARRYPWTFYQKSVEALLFFKPPFLRVELDGQLFKEGQAYIIACANGRYFGRNMHIAPSADIGDDLFQVLTVDAASRFELFRTLNAVYSAKHLLRSNVHSHNARTVRIAASDHTAIPMQLDGETRRGHEVIFNVIPHALSLLTHHDQGIRQLT